MSEPSASERAAAEALKRAGFTDIRFIPAGGPARSADLLASRDGELWAVEVRSSSRPLRADASFEPPAGGTLPYPTLRDYLALLWREKRGQLEASRAAHGCARAMLLVVVEGEPSPAWPESLAAARRGAGRPEVTFALCRGGELLAEPPLDPNYP